MADAAPSPPEDEETSRVRLNRLLEALEAGLTTEEAEVFADNGIDIGQLRACVRAKRSPEEIARIVV